MHLVPLACFDVLLLALAPHVPAHAADIMQLEAVPSQPLGAAVTPRGCRRGLVRLRGATKGHGRGIFSLIFPHSPRPTPGQRAAGKVAGAPVSGKHAPNNGWRSVQRRVSCPTQQNMGIYMMVFAFMQLCAYAACARDFLARAASSIQAEFWNSRDAYCGVRQDLM